MTLRSDVARGRDLLVCWRELERFPAKWIPVRVKKTRQNKRPSVPIQIGTEKALAEERLAYLTEMFESGRWRRYYSDYAFLENIREAKIALETWRSLAMPHSPARNSIIDLSRSAPERATGLREVAPRPKTQASDPSPVIPVVARAEVPAAPLVGMVALQRVPDCTPDTDR